MIRVRRAGERQHDQTDEYDVWRTFPRPLDASDMGEDLGPLEVFDEVCLRPGTVLPGDPPLGAEIVTFVRTGALACEDTMSGLRLVQAGEFQCRGVGRGLLYHEANASRIEETHLFRIWLGPGRVDVESSRQQRRFSKGERRGALCLVASPNGRRGSLTIREDALVYSAVLDPGAHVVHELDSGRSSWLHIVTGQATVGGVVLSAGDGAAHTSELAVSLTATQPETEILLVDLGPRRRVRSAPRP